MRSVESVRLFVRRSSALALVVGALAMLLCQETRAEEAQKNSPSKLVINARTRTRAENSDRVGVIDKPLAWDASKTAIVICDMWDQHWCRGATARVAEMAPRMYQVVKAARERGVLIIHCPSSCMSFYKDTPMRKLAQDAPPVTTKIALQNWCKLDPMHESALPIDDSDGGCDCWPACAHGSPWKRQIASIEIKEGDAITDSGEAFYLMKQRGIENVIVMGVHTNMCVLGRPFSIRQMVYQGQNVVLMRDMTDTMYNSRRPPYVPHVRGTELVVNHIEQHWCPTITSTEFTGMPPFRFSEADQPHVVFMIGEPEYKTKETLPKFAKEYLEPRGIRCTIVHADEKDGNSFPGLEALKTADLLILSVRRRSPQTEQLGLVRAFLDAGKPVIGLRTASHAFHTRGQHPEGHDEWQELDHAVLGGNYTGHHAEGKETELAVAAGAKEHPILNGISTASLLGHGTLYKVSPLAKSTTPLLMGTIPNQPTEPVAWTNTYQNARVFYTSLGHPDDFNQPDFNKLLVNAVFWGLNK
jgi:type 1 glutamine amidotransferase/nicotinamidase-related amidase